MPCQCDDWKPSDRELAAQEAAKHLVYLHSQIGGDWLLPETRDVAQSPYGNSKWADLFTAQLCETCRKFTSDQRQRFLHNPATPEAAKLAAWWFKHLAADMEREKRFEPQKKS